MKKKIGIINLGSHNLFSIFQAIKNLNYHVKIVNHSKEIKRFDIIILPGVGTFDYAQKQIIEIGILEKLNDLVLSQKVPILGICLGAQLMTFSSEEGVAMGLKWVDGITVKFEKIDKKLPHMGWKDVNYSNQSQLFASLPQNSRFYFLHSYHFKFHSPEQITATTRHGYEFPVSFQKDNIYGVQFHPEKSHTFGMQIMKNFEKI